MDRISALRNVEDALAAFEDGDLALADLEREVRGILRTYATEFDAEADLAAWEATGAPSVDGLVVVAPDAGTARERVRALADEAEGSLALSVRRVSDRGK
jgi:phosphoribosylpyrophosphate synthetase